MDSGYCFQIDNGPEFELALFMGVVLIEIQFTFKLDIGG